MNQGETYSGENFILKTDINLNGAEWLPIGFETSDTPSGTSLKFSGNFDGNNCFVSNFTVMVNKYHDRSDNDCGFFGDIENGLNSSMTFSELKARLTDSLEIPTYIEMEQAYATSIVIDGYIYSFSWSGDGYNDVAPDCIYISVAS